MKGKNSKVAKVTVAQTMMLWTAVLALTVLRLAVATSGSFTESEAFLSVCAAHPAGSYIEGPAGVPLLFTLYKLLGGSGLFCLRCIGPLVVLILSWCVWWIGRRIAPHRPALALWSVLGLNLLPSLNLASLVMNGAVVMATMILLAIVAGWRVVAPSSKSSKEVAPWVLFGVALAVGTQFWQMIGLLLPIAIVFVFVNCGAKALPWRGIILSFFLLILGWIPSLAWNSHYDWVQFSSVAHGFDFIQIGTIALSLSLIVTTGAMVTPLLVRLAYVERLWRVIMISLASIASLASTMLLVAPQLIPPGLPSPIGVSGLSELSVEVLSLRKERPDPKGEFPFLIASTPGLAALLGSRVAVEYPERPCSPSVFVTESPSLNSSFALWPSYPDAVAAGAKDNLYTEEKSFSAFLGRNALYITTESKEELPQTITNAFNAVALLKEVPISVNGRQQMIRIYQCEGYRTLSL
ncbi:MAG: hypothetical protein WCR44_07825 [Verrucomicrobiota bacterium]